MFNSQAAAAMGSSSPQSSQHHRDSPRPSFGDDSINLGRQVRFVATLVSSPVLHSNRLHSPNDRPLLTGPAVEGPAGMLTQLLRVDEDAPMTTTTTDSSTNGAAAVTMATTIDDVVVMGQLHTSDTPNNNTAMVTESTVHEGSTTAVASPPLGRRETTVFSPKSKKQVVVKRSARLKQSN